MKTLIIANEKVTGKGSSIEKPSFRPDVLLKDNESPSNTAEPNSETETQEATSNIKEYIAKSDSNDATKNAEAVKAEPTKFEINEQIKEQKLELNLEATIKLALDLNRRINQRVKLLETIGSLESFEIAQKDDAEETDSNYFQGCELSIEDDKRRSFNTKNPFIINAVAKMVNKLCIDKLAEIEGEIFIPAK